MRVQCTIHEPCLEAYQWGYNSHAQEPIPSCCEVQVCYRKLISTKISKNSTNNKMLLIVVTAQTCRLFREKIWCLLNKNILITSWYSITKESIDIGKWQNTHKKKMQKMYCKREARSLDTAQVFMWVRSTSLTPRKNLISVSLRGPSQWNFSKKKK